MQSKLGVVYMTPREAKNHHGQLLSAGIGGIRWTWEELCSCIPTCIDCDLATGIDCDAGQVLHMPEHSMRIFGDDWQYSQIKCSHLSDV